MDNKGLKSFAIARYNADKRDGRKPGEVQRRYHLRIMQITQTQERGDNQKINAALQALRGVVKNAGGLRGNNGR